MRNRDGYRRFVLLSVARTGSTWLQRMLAEHPHVVAFDEIFGGIQQPSYAAFAGRLLRKALNGSTRGSAVDRTETHLERINAASLLDEIVWGAAYTRSVRAVGFKVLLAHLRYHRRFPDLPVQLTRRLPETDVILLRRENWLRQVVSLFRAQQTGQWEIQRDEKPKDAQPLQLEPPELRREFERCRRDYRQLERFCRPARRVCRVSYEALQRGTDEQWRRVQAFLDVPPIARPAVPLGKQNTAGLADALADYGRLKKCFVGTEWEPFFDE